MKIGLTGPYCDNNFGDYTMLINNIMDINLIYSDSIEEYIIFAYDKLFLEHILQYYFPRYKIEIIEVKTNSNNWEMVKESKRFEITYSDINYTSEDIVNMISNYDEVRNAVESIDVLILSGGGCFNYYWLAEHRANKFYKMVAPMLLARKSSKRIISLGNTFGPWGSEVNTVFFKRILEAIDFDCIGIRDSVESKKQLRNLGLTSNIVDIIDDAYFLNDKLVNTTRILENKYVIIEAYNSLAELEKNIEMIKMFVDMISKVYGYNVIFLPFGDNYGGVKQGEYLKMKIPNLVLYREIVKDGLNFAAIENVYSLIRNAEIVLCDRYHAFVVALANNTPCVQYIRNIDNSIYYYTTKCIGTFSKIMGSHVFGGGKEANSELFFTTKFASLFCADAKKLDNIMLKQKELFNDQKNNREILLKKERQLYLSKLWQ